jgi:hypothetical protein
MKKGYKYKISNYRECTKYNTLIYFARKEFAYSDYGVSEIITGYGSRLINKQMEKMGL